MSVTKEQLTEVADKLFNEMDANKDGKLQKEEVKKFTIGTMKVIKPEAAFDEAEFEENFKTLDVNGDGWIAKDELYQSLYKKAKDAGALADGQ